MIDLKAGNLPPYVSFGEKWSEEHGDNDFVASTKLFVNIASANQNC